MIKKIFNDLRLLSHDIAAILTIVPFLMMMWQQYFQGFSTKLVNPSVLVEISKQVNKKF